MAGKELDLLLQRINSELPAIYTWLFSNRLTLNLSKARYLVFQPRQKVNSNLYPPLKIAVIYLYLGHHIVGRADPDVVRPRHADALIELYPGPFFPEHRKLPRVRLSPYSGFYFVKPGDGLAPLRVGTDGKCIAALFADTPIVCVKVQGVGGPSPFFKQGMRTLFIAPGWYLAIIPAAHYLIWVRCQIVDDYSQDLGLYFAALVCHPEPRGAGYCGGLPRGRSPDSTPRCAGLRRFSPPTLSFPTRRGRLGTISATKQI